jgi:membrane fusion protein (multidrug efflux system)
VTDADPWSRPIVPIVGVALLLLAAGLFVTACGDDEAGAGATDGTQAGPVNAVPVETVRVRTATLRDTVGAAGSLNALEEVELQSESTGPVVQVHFEEGTRVERGRTLVTIDPDKLRSELGARRAALESAEARQELARRTFERVRTLYERGSASREELDEAESARDQNRADVRRLASEIELMEERLEDTVVAAPFTGMISERMVDAGDFVDVGEPLATLYRIDTLEVAFGLPERFYDRVAPGQEVTATVSAYPDREFSGEVRFISPAVDVATRTFRVKARIDNSEGLLKPGTFADVRVTLERREDRPVVPEEALVSTRSGYIAFVVEDGTAHRREVTVGLREPGLAEIREGLEAGETVVRAGQMNLADGVPIEVVDRAPRAAGGPGSLPR